MGYIDTERHGWLFSLRKDESFCVCVYSTSHMWQHVGGWWLGGLQLADHRGPESVLTEMFAQLKHHSLRQITEGRQ